MKEKNAEGQGRRPDPDTTGHDRVVGGLADRLGNRAAVLTLLVDA